MVSLLLIISFLLHIVSFIAIYFLYQQFEQVKRTKNEQLETVLGSFLDEIKAENEQLQKQLQHEGKKKQVFNNREKEQIISEEKTAKEVKKVKKRENIYQTSTPQIPIEQKVDKLETSLEAQVIQMAQVGMSADEIAQKLNRGKTEIELMLKLQLK